MAKLLLLLGAAAALVAAAVRRQGLRDLAGRIRGGQTGDPTITRLPEPRMPVTAQATVAPQTLEPAAHPEEERAEGRADAEARGPAGEARG
jgi:hypothetical protein